MKNQIKILYELQFVLRLSAIMLLISCYSFGILHSQWSVPVNISPGTTAIGTNENAGQCIAISGDTLRVVYTDRSNSIIKVMYNQSPDRGATWGTPLILQSSANCSFTAIANWHGNIHVVWMDLLGASNASFYKRSLDGGLSWQPTICLDSFTKFWPGIACWGDLVIATLNKDLSGNTEVFIKRSLDNGKTWQPSQQITHAINRSEDPAINMIANDVHLSWNDKRNGIMNIYYCHSPDGGVNWDPETRLTTIDSYTSMVSLNGKNVDVPHAIRTSNSFDIWLAESNDIANTFLPNQQLSKTDSATEIYPFMVRDAQKLHIVYAGKGGTNYLYSGDGGVSWNAPVFLSPSSQPFIAYTDCVLHVIFSNAGHLNYMRNPTGNCLQVNNQNTSSKNEMVAYPIPVDNNLTVQIPSNDALNKTDWQLLNLDGCIVMSDKINSTQFTVNTQALPNGIYFLKTQLDNTYVLKFIVQHL